MKKPKQGYQREKYCLPFCQRDNKGSHGALQNENKHENIKYKGVTI